MDESIKQQLEQELMKGLIEEKTDKDKKMTDEEFIELIKK